MLKLSVLPQRSKATSRRLLNIWFAWATIMVCWSVPGVSPLLAARGGGGNYTPLIPLPSASVSTPNLAAQLPANSKQKAKLVEALRQLDHGSTEERKKAATQLLREAKQFGAAAQLPLRQAVARGLAGLSSQGEHRVAPSPGYRAALAQVLKAAGAQGSEAQNKMIAFVATVWRNAEGSHIEWTKPPFSLAKYSDTNVAKAVMERVALADWQKGQSAQAMKGYRKLAALFAQTPRRSDFDLRALDMARDSAKSAEGIKIYDAALTQTEKLYLDPQLLGSGHEGQVKQISADLSRRHQALVEATLSAAQAASASRSLQQQSATMATAFIGTLPGPKVVQKIKMKLAVVYVNHARHGEAVAVYKDLEEHTNEPEQKKQFLTQAIKSQSILAHWPLGVPWSNAAATAAAEGGGSSEAEGETADVASANQVAGSVVAKAHPDEREELLHLYQQLAALTPRPVWVSVGHQGLIQLDLGHEDDAFKLWTETLHKDSTGIHAANAAGYMLTAYLAAQSWKELEDLARFCLKQKLTPMKDGKALPVNDILAAALLASAKVAMSEHKYLLAVVKLNEFVTQHRGVKHYDEGFYLLGVAYHESGKYPEAVRTLLAFTDQFPKSSFYGPGLLSGGDYSAPMAYEENTMHFYSRFVLSFAADPEAQRVRDALTAVYLGRGRYGEAVGVLRLTLAAEVAPEIKIQALTQILTTEEKHGELKRARSAAEELLRQDGISPDARGHALAVIARFAASQNRFAEVSTVVQQLDQASTPAEFDALGEARYLLAETKSANASKEDYNPSLRDPGATLNGRYNSYKVLRQGYLNVCATNPNAYCAQAMLRLSQLSLDFAKTAEEINIQSTLSAQEIGRFKQLKQGIMNDVARTSEQADARAVASVNAGVTGPDTTEAVLWQNTSDWNFDRVSGETGNGFTQL